MNKHTNGRRQKKNKAIYMTYAIAVIPLTQIKGAIKKRDGKYVYLS
jgi:hypothetical protein